MCLWSLALPQRGHSVDTRFSPASPHASPLLEGPTVAQGAPTPEEQAARGVGEGLGVEGSLGELILTLQKRKALPRLHWHHSTCTHLRGVPPSPTPAHPDPTFRGYSPLGDNKASQEGALLQGANPALSCPQLPCAHSGPWGASPPLRLSLQGGTLLERRD